MALQTRLEALQQAVVARRDDDTPEQLVERAEAFREFLEENQSETSVSFVR